MQDYCPTMNVFQRLTVYIVLQLRNFSTLNDLQYTVVQNAFLKRLTVIYNLAMLTLVCKNWTSSCLLSRQKMFSQSGIPIFSSATYTSNFSQAHKNGIYLSILSHFVAVSHNYRSYFHRNLDIIRITISF